MKRLLAFLLSLSVMLTCVGGLSISVFADSTLQGSGTVEDPYLIASAEDFALIANNLSADYKQTADFTVTAPITGAFSGTYDGNGHTINAQIEHAIEATADPVGLFFKVKGNSDTDYAEIKNLTLTGSVKSTNTSLKSQTGGFIGAISGQYVKLTDLTNRASVYSKCSGDEVGGFVGRAYQYNIVVENCVNYGKIEAWSYAGGIFGMGGATNVSLTNCANYGYILGATAGGIVGWSYDNIFESCMNFGLVKSGTSSSSKAAGITPYVSRAVVINNCFNAGEISATSKAGLLIDASATYGMTITNSYNAFPGVPAFITEGAVANTVTNTYNIEASDTIATVVTDDELMELNISDKFMVFANKDEYASFENSAYRFPQLKENLVSKEAIIGLGTQGNPYLIATGEQFNYFFGENADYQTFKGGKYFNIVDDVDLTGVDYLPFSTPQTSAASNFAGYVYGVDFDGNPVQRTIDFGTIGSSAKPYKGMPNKKGGTTYYTGAFAGIIANSEFKNLTLEGTLYAGANYAGGLTGYINGTAIIDNVVNEMDIISTAGYMGGIAGVNSQTGAEITNCVNNGDISGTTFVSGILGSSGRALKVFKNNKNTGHIKGTNAGVGGVVGTFTGHSTAFTLTVENCVNEGIVESTGGYVGGIVGQGQQSTAGFPANLVIKNSKNIGEVSGANYVGGILGGSNYDPTKCESEIDIINCVNTGTVTAASQYTGGIAGSAFNSRISYCQNLGKVVSTYEGGHSFVAGVLGFVKILKPSGTFGVYNSFNAGELSYLKTRNGGLVGYVWKEVASGDDVATYEIKDSYSVGELTTTSANKINGSFLGSIYRKAAYANDKGVIISGCYSTLPYQACAALWSAPYDTPLTVTDSYNASTLASAETGYELISEEELIDLTNKEGSAFNDSEVWAASENGYLYPQIVGNIYDVKVTPVPLNLAVSYVDGSYILTWATNEEATGGYKVLIDGVQVGGIVTEKEVDITSAIKGKNVTIKVVAIDSTEYESEEIRFSAIFVGGGTGEAGDPYVISDASELALIKDYPSSYFVQNGDIENVTEMIGFTLENPFTGKYDGAGYTIDIDITSEESALESDNIGTGLFPYISGKAEIHDLTITGKLDSHTANTGAVVGLCVTNGFKLYNLNNYATVTGAKRETAGVIGRAYKTGTIENCYNYGDVISLSTASGITGVISNLTVLKDCGNYGNVQGSSNSAGICAWAYAGVTNCFNVGKITGTTVAGILGQVQANFDGKTGKPTAQAVIEDCYNAGTLEGSTTYGIATRATGRIGCYTVIGCYNATSATYPISDLTDEFVKSFNEEWASVDDGKYVVTGVTDCFYLTTSEEDSINAGAAKVTTLDDLKAIDFASAAYSKAGDYAYPQLTTNLIDAEYDDIDFALITSDTSELSNTSIYFKRIANNSYVKKGDQIVLVIVPNEFYTVEVFKGEGSLGEFTEQCEVLVEITGNTNFSATETEVEVTEPDTMVTGNEIFATNNEPITVDEKEYTKYAIVAGKVAKVAGLKVQEFGILMNRTDGEFTLDNAAVKAPANASKINENGWYGILIHSTDAEKGLKDGQTYYTRPYATYVDKDGNTYTAYGEIQSFVLDKAE